MPDGDALQLLTRIAEALEGIRDGLEAIVASAAAPEELPPGVRVCPGCGRSLAPEQRVDFGVTNGQPDWQCRECGYRTVS